MTHHYRISLAFTLSVALAACSGVGNGANTVVAPTAVVTPLQYKATAAGSNTTITVRSGADVQLSGKDSSSGNISITSFVWQQTDTAPAPQVTLLYRNSNTVSFMAPSVAQNTTLNFQLTVTNASGRTSTATAQVIVQPGSDPNRFLLVQATPGALAVPRHFRVGVSTVGGLSGLTADVPVCVRLNRTLSYSPRSGAANSGSLALPARQVDAKWLAITGGAAGFDPTTPSYTNPMVSFALPSFNDDDVFAQYNTAAGEANTDLQLVASDVDSAYVQMAVTATPGSCDGTATGAALANSTLMLQLYDETGKPIGAAVTATAAGAAVAMSSSLNPTLPMTPDGSSHLTPDDIIRAESLRGNNSALETRESATAYYAAIDPTSAKTTLSAWLASNCFDASAADYGASETQYSVVRSVYTNNFDLGFGRDMYFATCPDGTMASVVVNYPSLQAAANKIGAFLAVAMEYRPPAGSSAACFTNVADPTSNTGACITSFYSFAPDDRTGEFKRILSANFDRRGQKYLPGSCTACHGGSPGFASGQPYPKAGAIDANFLPWDLGTLLFGDTDPAFSCAKSNQNPNCTSINAAFFNKSIQAPQIQKLNALAWRTYQHVELAPSSVLPGAPQVDRYLAPRALLTQWYGGDPAASTAHAFDDSVTPPAWYTPGQTTSAADDLYHKAFAHYCRSCHTQIAAPTFQFASYASFANLFGPNFGSVAGSIYSQAVMPLSRLTMDRFWQDFDGGTSAAQTLGVFINSMTPTPVVAVDASNNVVGSGAPQITIPTPWITAPRGAPTPTLSTTLPNSLPAAPGIALDAVSNSLFAGTYQWSLCAVGAPTTAGGACPGATFGVIGTPLVPAGSSAGAAEAGAAIPAFPTSVAGSYYLTLNANSGITGAAPRTYTYQLVVPAPAP